jgi:hypothetical protein
MSAGPEHIRERQRKSAFAGAKVGPPPSGRVDAATKEAD